MTDEKFTLQETNKERSKLIPSARKKRSHTGKGGAMKTPSDFLSYSEKQKLSGSIESVVLNRPMEYEQFSRLPDDLKETYMKRLIEDYHGSTCSIAQMFGISESQVKSIRTGMKITYPKEIDGSKWLDFIAKKPEIPSGPISRTEFDRMPLVDQQAYLQGLRDRYDLTLSQITELLHMGRKNANNRLKALGVKLNTPGTLQDPKKKAAWSAVIAAFKESAADEPVNLSKEELNYVDTDIKLLEELSEKHSGTEETLPKNPEAEENQECFRVRSMNLSVEIDSWSQLDGLLRNIPIEKGTRVRIRIGGPYWTEMTPKKIGTV